MGPDKRRLSIELYERLKQQYAPQGLAHFGQGKWYPGEPLPRWSLTCFWRRDGEPIWRDPKLLDDERTARNVGAGDAGNFLGSVAQCLGLARDAVFPAYEDVLYYQWREQQLPINVDHQESKVDDPNERERFGRLFKRGLDEIVGFVLPLRHEARGSLWQTGSWFLRTERCYLVPGDSPLGLRLPLQSLPWVSKEDYPYTHEPDPMAPAQTLPPHTDLRSRSSEGIASPGPTPGPAQVPQPGKSAAQVVRTAMCVEIREGRLHVFMPPTDTLEAYLELIAAVEATAESLGQPVVIEGYEPPRDARLNSFRITPDPGVIEVNIHPSSSWDELVGRTTHLYDAARQTRLTSEKFMLDGRHTGTGGGNHFVLGGETPADSPFLRRPDLLRSLLGYWHNHPSLSYMFSGLFIGPTSQAPRVDEARNDSLYELEIAFDQVPPPGEPCPPWLVDRLFRNLLIDSSGNTHRAEFSIDKMFSPDGPTGRLGLLELRAFEMPPHERMSLTQQLLLRALVARFWREPYRPLRLARWGTELHDRYLLPFFIEQDFADVITEMNHAGFALHREWFHPHLEFRFPKVGDFATRGVQLELRQALEPWHVMGEEGSAGSTVRNVDASLERLQVKVTGLAPDRYTITCNGNALPLHPTGVVGEFVAGVRYRAWQPASSLHPTIGVHSPLVFDLLDTWMNRSLGGCQYHVTHPGGLSYDSFPVNAFESESRRLARFARIGHTPGELRAHIPPRNPEYPFTLDLRRV